MTKQLNYICYYIENALLLADKPDQTSASSIALLFQGNYVFKLDEEQRDVSLDLE